jgi:hypothetical protein
MRHSPNKLAVANANDTVGIRLKDPAMATSRAPSAASLAPMMVEPRRGSGPSTIASRRSKPSASHSRTAMKLTVTIEYMIRSDARYASTGSSMPDA